MWKSSGVLKSKREGRKPVFPGTNFPPKKFSSQVGIESANQRIKNRITINRANSAAFIVKICKVENFAEIFIGFPEKL